MLSEGHSVLSGAISHGGDLRAKSHSALGVQDAYNFTRYVVHLRRTWKKICTLNELWNGLQRKQDETCLPSELSLASLVICLTSLIIKVSEVRYSTWALLLTVKLFRFKKYCQQNYIRF